MSRTAQLLTSLFMAAGIGLVAQPSFAQGAGCPGMGPGSANVTEMRAERMQKHQKQLHDALKLNPDQEAGWKKYTESMAPQSGPMMAGRSEEMAKLSAPERADKMLEFAKSRQERMTEHVAALKTFYGTLSAEQKKAFDGFHSGPRGRGGPARGGDKPPAPTN